MFFINGIASATSESYYRGSVKLHLFKKFICYLGSFKIKIDFSQVI